jgi:hypothetical protein
MRRVVRLLSCAACKRDGAAKLAGGYGGALRLTIAFRFFESGTNTETPRGRNCSTFGGCPTCRSSIVMPTRPNLRVRPAVDARHAPSKLIAQRNSGTTVAARSAYVREPPRCNRDWWKSMPRPQPTFSANAYRRGPAWHRARPRVPQRRD